VIEKRSYSQNAIVTVGMEHSFLASEQLQMQSPFLRGIVAERV
jgi:hypothetical protein